MNGKPTSADLAGYANEYTAWKLLKEVSGRIIESKQLVVNPFLIEMSDDGCFVLKPSEAQEAGFDAPEVKDGGRFETSAVWSLGATIFYIVMGRQVMNSKGGQGQSETSKLPYMRSEWSALSELVQQCLQFNPDRRPVINDVYDVATKQHNRCVNDIKRGPRLKSVSSSPNPTANGQQDMAFWPEAMQNIH